MSRAAAQPVQANLDSDDERANFPWRMEDRKAAIDMPLTGIKRE